MRSHAAEDEDPADDDPADDDPADDENEPAPDATGWRRIPERGKGGTCLQPGCTHALCGALEALALRRCGTCVKPIYRGRPYRYEGAAPTHRVSIQREQW